MMHSIIKVVQPSGILDGIRGKQLRQEINDIIETQVDIVLIDLQNVKFMDSSGLGTLVSAHKMVQNTGAKLFLCSINEQAQMLLNLTKMNHLFEIFASRDEFEQKIIS